jgi:hypothetical protein
MGRDVQWTSHGVDKGPCRGIPLSEALATLQADNGGRSLTTAPVRKQAQTPRTLPPGLTGSASSA